MKIVNRQIDANCITHNGTMHADEVFATAFLEEYLGERKVFRTSNVDKNSLADDAIVYDIGRGKYDHHQPDALKRDDGITYCSFGLLWKDFGRDYLKMNDYSNAEELWNYIDKDLVEGIDADDNGIFPKIEAIYKVKTISGIIKLFNPSFDSFEDESLQFIKAVDIAKKILIEEILYANGKVMANKEINELLDDLSDNSKYLILDRFLPYEETILNREDRNNILFVAFPSNRGGYAIKTVPKSLTDRTARMMFPKEWAGLEGSNLEEVSGISGLTFCHTGRFIVNCRNYGVALEVLNKLCN